MTHLTRRRFLTISAAAGLFAHQAHSASPVSWRGVALGAHSEMQLVGLTQAQAAPIIRDVTAELSRLEDIFSLYREGSVLSVLNRDGAFAHPPAELLQVCSSASTLHEISDGAFDPTVQPLWALAARTIAAGKLPTGSEIERVRSLVDWSAVQFDSSQIAFARPGMAMTLNGLAQGFVTDRIAGLLRATGLSNVLIDFGEIRAWGHSGLGEPWRVGIAAPGGSDCCKARVTLSDRALATSATLGTVLDDKGSIGHILDPRTGRTAGAARLASVSASSASLADGLSTTLCAMDAQRIPDALAAFPDAKLEHLEV